LFLSSFRLFRPIEGEFLIVHEPPPTFDYKDIMREKGPFLKRIDSSMCLIVPTDFAIKGGRGSPASLNDDEPQGQNEIVEEEEEEDDEIRM
jgi:hypothetical protein